jgi:hypothetical protein
MVLELQTKTTHREELSLVVRRHEFYLMPVQQLAGGVIDAGDSGLVAGLGLAPAPIRPERVAFAHLGRRRPCCYPVGISVPPLAGFSVPGLRPLWRLPVSAWIAPKGARRWSIDAGKY